MAVSIKCRSDRAITQRQKKEKIHETVCLDNVDRFKTEQKALWENRMSDVLRANRVRSKVGEQRANREATLQARRHRLAALLAEEQAAYEQETVDREETPQQRMDKMAVRAYEMKKRREDERKSVVQEKLYQQWRDGIDELRKQDSKLVELKTIAARDAQLAEKEETKCQEVELDKMFDRLWHEGYQAKVEREAREKELKHERNELQKQTLQMQLDARAQQEKEKEDLTHFERGEMRKLWTQQEQEAKDKAAREKVFAKEERKKMDDFAKIQQDQKTEAVRVELQQDRDFVEGVLAREQALEMQELAEKKKARQKAVEFTEALKLEMARKAESEEKLIQLQKEESERQWQKRYNQWEKEELARRGLMEEVYRERSSQVELKREMRDQLKSQVVEDRTRIDSEVSRLEEIEKERDQAEALLRARQQEELFRQMDFHQVKRHRQLQQHQIEQHKVAVEMDKLQKAVSAEQKKCSEVMNKVQDDRNAKQLARSAPFATDD